jgi:heme/copper-type cytochrome/quinol oxidase subunit 3
LFLNPFNIPLINTFILLRRGFRITIFHINLIKNKKDFFRLIITLFLALFFLFIQLEEYLDIGFSFSERIFGRSFFISTGFHGIHVFFGIIFIFFNFIRYNMIEFNKSNILRIEFSIIY